MTNKTAPKRDPSSLTVRALKDEAPAEAVSRVALSPSVQAALTVAAYTTLLGELSIDKLVAELSDQAKAVQSGSLKPAEAMLANQAHTLDIKAEAIGKSHASKGFQHRQ